MKISSCNSRKWFRKRYFFSIRSSGLVKVNCSTEGIVAFFRTMRFCHYTCACTLLLLLKNYLRDIPVYYALERHPHAFKRTRTNSVTQIIWNIIRVTSLGNILNHFLLLKTVLQGVSVIVTPNIEN